MARKPNRNGRGPGGGEANQQAAYEWFATADSDVASCADWDIKADQLAETVLLLLSKARGIMFTLTYDQAAIRVSVLDGGSKQTRRVEDSIEFDDALAMIRERAVGLEKRPKEEWKP